MSKHFLDRYFVSFSCRYTLNLCKISLRTDRRTDGQSDDGVVTPKCHLCLQQVTQNCVKGNPTLNTNF